MIVMIHQVGLVILNHIDWSYGCLTYSNQFLSKYQGLSNVYLLGFNLKRV